VSGHSGQTGGTDYNAGIADKAAYYRQANEQMLVRALAGARQAAERGDQGQRRVHAVERALSASGPILLPDYPAEQLWPVRSMNRLLVKLAITGMVGALLSSNPSVAQFHGPQSQTPPPQILPPQKRAEHVEITKGPALEISHDDVAIIRWTTTNPGGDDDHFAIIHYGTDPEDLSQTAKNHIRLNRAHAETIFRVRMDGPKPLTTYYYKVTSMGSGGESDQPLHHSRPGSGNQRFPAAPIMGNQQAPAWITRASSSSASMRCAPRSGTASSPISSGSRTRSSSFKVEKVGVQFVSCVTARPCGAPG
jgi:hypothetical protein